VLRAIRSLMPDVVFLLVWHRWQVGRFPNLFAPRTFNELILKRCLAPDARYAALTDKLTVRSYVESRVGNRHLIPIVAIADPFTRDVFDALPDAFVMKANHGSGFVEVVRSKAGTSYEALRQLADRWMATNFYDTCRERHYRGLRPRIYFEHLLQDADGRIPADIKLHCFCRHEGAPEIYAAVISDRFGEARGDFFDARWNPLDIAVGDYPRSVVPQAAPTQLDGLLEVAARLSDGFDYVRVDLYALGDRIYFGELTFTPGAGVFPFTPDRVDLEWGRLLRDAQRAARSRTAPKAAR
jgi:hypothetical protein